MCVVWDVYECEPARARGTTGTYVATTGASAPHVCPVGTFCHMTGMSGPEPCAAGAACIVAGLSSAPGCAVATFAPSVGASTCRVCSQAGTYCPRVGLSVAVNCPPGACDGADACWWFVHACMLLLCRIVIRERERERGRERESYFIALSHHGRLAPALSRYLCIFEMYMRACVSVCGCSGV
jgi:hypothetical protein